MSVRTGKPSFSTTQFRSAELLSELIKRIAHEIGNPLTAIISIAGILNFQGNPDNKKLQEYSRSISKEAWRINALTEKLVLLLSIKQTGARTENIQEVIENSLKKLEARYQVEPPEVILNLTPKAHAIEIDQEQFTAMIIELIHNAKSFSKPNSAVELKTSSENESLKIEVKNYCKNECPFPLAKIFEPFISEVSDSYRLGLGLSSIVSVVERYHGTIEVTESKDQKDYQFAINITLPLSEK